MRGDVTDAGQPTERTTEDMATQPMEAGGCVSQLSYRYRYRYFLELPYRYQYFQKWPCRYRYFSKVSIYRQSIGHIDISNRANHKRTSDNDMIELATPGK